jgi:N-acetylglucosaminyldiphosphoundecaprenol N-acetyl-beta-D-mannosaminyltransferase
MRARRFSGIGARNSNLVASETHASNGQLGDEIDEQHCGNTTRATRAMTTESPIEISTPLLVDHCERFLPAFHFLGIRVNAASVSGLTAFVTVAIATNRQHIVACHNLHSLYLFHHDAKMRAFHQQAAAAHIDGMGIVLLGRLLGHPLGRRHRVTYLDWIDSLLSEATSRKWRILYVGLRESVCTRLPEIIGRDFPSLRLRAVHWNIESGDNSSSQEEVLRSICDFNPHILLVGMGMPRQERWILDNSHRLSANVILPCGAAMDYVAGMVAAPPRWMGRYGLEWLFRLSREPRHLWRRYLLEPWYVLRLLCGEILFRHSGSS